MAELSEDLLSYFLDKNYVHLEHEGGSGHGLSTTEFTVLKAIICAQLHEEDPPSMNELATRVGKSSRTVRATISKLEHYGFVNRVSSTGGRNEYRFNGLMEQLRAIRQLQKSTKEKCSMSATKKRKYRRYHRSKSERLEYHERRAAELIKEIDFEYLCNAIKGDTVSEKDKKKYRRLLRYCKTMKKARAAFLYFNRQDEAELCHQLYDDMFEDLKKMEGSIVDMDSIHSKPQVDPQKETCEELFDVVDAIDKKRIGKCHILWDHYLARPCKKRLKAVLAHLELMKSSGRPSALNERAKFIRKANKKARELGLM